MKMLIILGVYLITLGLAGYLCYLTLVLLFLGGIGGFLLAMGAFSLACLIVNLAIILPDSLDNDYQTW